MQNNQVKDRMISTKKKGKKIFNVDNYAELELFPPSADTMSSSNGRGVDSLSLSKVKNKRYY